MKKICNNINSFNKIIKLIGLIKKLNNIKYYINTY